MKDMKQLINKWGESMLFSLLMALCLTWTFTACSDDKDNEYISDTQLSILEDNRTSLSYLLKNSTFGTAPGTFPEASKEILNNAIAELDQLITKVKGGEMFDEATFEATIAKVNQAIDEFKNSKYYNLSPEAQKFISDLMAKADELREMIANEALWGNHQGQYPVEGKATLESAAEDLESLADRIKTSAITDMTQEIYDDAIAAALADLGAAREEVDITVIDEGSKGFLGMFGSKDAVVLVKKNFNPEKEAETFLKEVFLSMGLIVKIKTEQKDKHLYIDLTGDDMGILIGKRGQTLDALQYLVNLVVNKKSPYYISVMLDTENYRQRRKETLESLAFNLAKKVKHTKRNVVLEPMNPYERRIIHSALQNDRFVTTYSEGEEPYRNVVITLK